jgi:FO synthase
MVSIPALGDRVVPALGDLMAEAAEIRDRVYGPHLTWSPRIVIPLTTSWRDLCRDCGSPGVPDTDAEPYLDPEQVLAIARQGAAAGRHEAHFMLGPDPELQTPAAGPWLSAHGYESTLDYVLAACQLVLDETGLLPHVTTEAPTAEALAALRTVAPAQGMMLSLVDGDADAELTALEAAGRLRIPFSVGMVVGLGESLDQRANALRMVAGSHLNHRHVQEVSIRRLSHERTDELAVLLETVALARIILPPSVSLQVAPGAGEVDALLDAGMDDWNGLEPGSLPEQIATRNFTLAPRLALRPVYVAGAADWVDPALHFAVLDRSDAAGFARDDPGTVLPHRFATRNDPGGGPEVALIGPRSTAWYAGGDAHPPTLLPAAAGARGAVREVLDGVLLGQETGEAELVTLFGARGPEVAAVCEVADDLRRATNGDAVTFVKNRNINYTNVCTFRCRFCGFSKGPLSLNLRGKPYLLTMEAIVERVVEATRCGATEVCLQGGIHPDFDGEYYLHVLQAVKVAAPSIHVHGFTALEVSEGARRLGEPLEAYLRRLAAAGLGSLPGTAAEVLDDEIRAVICPDKITTDEWLEVHRVAHGIGLRSNVTIMFGTVERPVHWVRHMLRTRALQRETGGFTEFVPLPFVHMAAPLYLERRSRRGPTFREALLMHAVGRIAYHGTIDNIQGSWVKLGLPGLTQVLQAGVNDIGGTLMGENISRAAGALHGQEMTGDDFRGVVDPLGRRLEQRTTLYGPLASP